MWDSINAILALIKCQGHRLVVSRSESNNFECIMNPPDDLSVQYFSYQYNFTVGLLNCRFFIIICFGSIKFIFNTRNKLMQIWPDCWLDLWQKADRKEQSEILLHIWKNSGLWWFLLFIPLMRFEIPLLKFLSSNPPFPQPEAL